MIKRFNEYSEFKDRESTTRTKPLLEEEFLSILRDNCKIFSFDNDLLYRGTNSEFGPFGLFFEGDRKSTIGNYNYNKFFSNDENYPVKRKSSLIGSTTLKGADWLSSEKGLYLVIPFDNSNIVFTPVPDMAFLHKSGLEYNDDMFILKQYNSNFKIPNKELIDIINNNIEKTNNKHTLSLHDDHGFEFFTNGNCLLLSTDKIEWLKSKI